MSGEGASRVLDVQVRSENGTEIVTVHGEVDMASAPQLQAALEDAQRGGNPLVVDMSDVGFLGSAGLSALLVVSEAAQPQRLRVVASDAVRRPIELTALDKLLAVYDTLDAALAEGTGTSAN
ncbi:MULTISPECIES: STAS domain-containing protein [Nocardia]|uniref:Anti-sigma factor antagonist n=2 Tax=Nocardia farcinica TaxID=37329 RepID=Q5Z3J4_NOCFA|nr:MULTISPECIES: STAS domain-containing protein [Nocardia]MCZ9326429.1 STAS domain-containing protein [Nocardia farcinica]PEH78447.1 anti-sigma factor antagonist [Nocardia sp. FDAARGOS_372]PFX01987.1 Anti-sigma-F factor antagonist RsfB [Nocardia farcinica]PFX08780.1 Anti-sigma-F factor antagonist RsfB [Nocardia farcinica]UEX23045.1 STAS domain-containing protein [Nocardia farcinica]